MRALAQVQLKSSPETKQAVEERFNLSDEKETSGKGGAKSGRSAQQTSVQAGADGSSEEDSSSQPSGEGPESEGGAIEEEVLKPKKFVPARRHRRAAAQQLRQEELAGILRQEAE